MSHTVESFLVMGPAANVGPDGLDALFAGLDARACQPAQLLAKYRMTPAGASVDDLCEDLTAYQQIFAFGALSILQPDQHIDWRQELRTVRHAADGMWKAAALYRLAMFMSHGELHTRPTNELGRLLWEGDISDPTFRHLFLYEVLAQGPRPGLHPWRHIKSSHGRLFVELFGTEQAIALVREGRVARLFQDGLLGDLQEIVLDPTHAEGYKAFFTACLATHERERGTPFHGHYGYESWTPERLKRLVLDWSGSERFRHRMLAGVFDMIGW